MHNYPCKHCGHCPSCGQPMPIASPYPGISPVYPYPTVPWIIPGPYVPTITSPFQQPRPNIVIGDPPHGWSNITFTVNNSNLTH